MVEVAHKMDLVKLTVALLLLLALLDKLKALWVVALALQIAVDQSLKKEVLLKNTQPLVEDLI